MADKEKFKSVRYVGGNKVCDEEDEEDEEEEEDENEDDEDYGYASVLEEVDVTAVLLGTLERIAMGATIAATASTATTATAAATAAHAWEAEVRGALRAGCDVGALGTLLTLAGQRHEPAAAPAALFPFVSAAAGAAGATGAAVTHG